jgi:tRNA (guanine-N7-)-methyltransferase
MKPDAGSPAEVQRPPEPRAGSEGGPGAQRGVRSWVRREGRLTPAQGRALAASEGQRLLARPQDAHFDVVGHFGRRAPLTLEIGCGNGEFITHAAARRPGDDFIGLEVHRPGLGHALQQAERSALTNLVFFELDAAEHLDRLLPDDCLSRCCVFFPDPWPKKRHHKRRLLQAAFARVLWRKLRAEGRLFLATDWADYHAWMLELFEASPDWVNALGPGRDAPRPAWRPLTRFEARGRRLGHSVHDLIYLPVGKPIG